MLINYQGVKGSKGDGGSRGDKGSVGRQGISGDPGDTGDKGAPVRTKPVLITSITTVHNYTVHTLLMKLIFNKNVLIVCPNLFLTKSMYWNNFVVRNVSLLGSSTVRVSTGHARQKGCGWRQGPEGRGRGHGCTGGTWYKGTSWS